MGNSDRYVECHRTLQCFIDLVTLVIIVGFTQVLSLLLGRIRQPRVIAEVIGGVILGPTVMGRIPNFTNSIFPTTSIHLLSLTSTIGIVFFLFIGFLKAIFLQMDYVFPKWGIRELGLYAPVGKISAINAVIIIFLAPVVGALTQKYAAYRMVVVGGVICSAGVFIMALPTEWFQPAAQSVIGQWLGHGYLTSSKVSHGAEGGLRQDNLAESNKPVGS